MKFLKEFNLSRELERYKYNAKNITDRQIKLKMYGLIGEERVYYALKHISNDLLCLYNIRIKDNDDSFQNDFLIIGNEKIVILEVKNLMDNIRINKDGTIDRIIHRKSFDEICGIYSPIKQVEHQAKKLEEYLKKHNYNVNIIGYVVMGNDKTKIINDSNLTSIIMYYDICEVIKKEFKFESLKQIAYDISTFLCVNNQKYDFNKYKKIQNDMLTDIYVPKNLNKKEYEIYLKIIEIRTKIHIETNMPIPYIFTNKEAENLVLFKPNSKDEFMMVPGFKEKRYNLFGEEVIKIFKKM